MKKLIILTLIGMAIPLVFPAASAASQPVSIFLDGDELKSDVEPVLDRGRVLIPLRAISESLGLSVEWSPSARVVPAFKAPELLAALFLRYFIITECKKFSVTCGVLLVILSPW